MSIAAEVKKITNYATKLGFSVEVDEAATGSTYITVYCVNFETVIRVSDHDPRRDCNANYYVDPTACSVNGALKHIDALHVEALEDEEAAEELSLVLAEAKKLASLKRKASAQLKKFIGAYGDQFRMEDGTEWVPASWIIKTKEATNIERANYLLETLEKQFELAEKAR